jgi:hypothetical protein
MSWITSLVAALKADTATKNLVAARIYPAPLPQDATMPAVTWSVPDEQNETALSGVVVNCQPTLYLHCWGETETSVRAVATAVKAVMLGFETECQGIYNIRSVGLYEMEPELRRIVMAGDVLAAS